MSNQSRGAVGCAVGGVCAALLAAAGCGGTDGPKTYPVNGKVIYKGGDVGKLAGYRVHFETVGEPRVAGTGEVEADGSFTAGCYLDGADRTGLPAGEYRALVASPRGDGGGSRPGLLHPRYASFDKSGLKVTVTTGTNTPTLEVEGR